MPNLSGQGGAPKPGATGSREVAQDVVLEAESDAGVQEEAGPLGE